VDHVRRKVKLKNSYKILVGKPEYKRPLGKPRHRWEENIRRDLRETGYIWLRIGTSDWVL
jgi:hypothetical protein